MSLDDYCREAEAIEALSEDVLAAATPESLQGAVSEAMLRGWFDLCRNLILHGRARKPKKVDFTSVVYVSPDCSISLWWWWWCLRCECYCCCECCECCEWCCCVGPLRFDASPAAALRCRLDELVVCHTRTPLV